MVISIMMGDMQHHLVQKIHDLRGYFTLMIVEPDQDTRLYINEVLSTRIHLKENRDYFFVKNQREAEVFYRKLSELDKTPDLVICRENADTPAETMILLKNLRAMRSAPVFAVYHAASGQDYDHTCDITIDGLLTESGVLALLKALLLKIIEEETDSSKQEELAGFITAELDVSGDVREHGIMFHASILGNIQRMAPVKIDASAVKVEYGKIDKEVRGPEIIYANKGIYSHELSSEKHVSRDQVTRRVKWEDDPAPPKPGKRGKTWD